MKMKKPIFYLTLVFLSLLIMSCTQNKMYRFNETICTTSNCEDNLIEIYADNNSTYDLTFIEFTERGNFLNRNKYQKVIEHITTEEKKAKNGVMLLVFAHGWHNNASKNSRDVKKFRALLKILSKRKNNSLEKKIVGVYIGWRGRVFPEIPLIKDIPTIKDWVDFDYMSYWSRKSVASQVGNGGVTELLLKFSKITNNPKKINEKANIYVVAGHSLGSDVILSSMKNILLERIVNTENIPFSECKATLNNIDIESHYDKYCQEGCVKTKRFADAIFLLNPAVEANELLQLKTLVAQEHCYAREQEKLLHILTSTSDTATQFPFFLGQWLSISTNTSELDLIANVNTEINKSIILKEYELDTTTVGHYKIFRTGKQEENFSSDDYNFTACWMNGQCVDDKEYKAFNFPVSPFEPISIISVDKDSIRNHTDIFNESTIAYMSSAVLANQYRRYGFKISNALKESNETMANEYEKACYYKKGIAKYNFKNCAKKFYELYKNDF